MGRKELALRKLAKRIVLQAEKDGAVPATCAAIEECEAEGTFDAQEIKEALPTDFVERLKYELAKLNYREAKRLFPELNLKKIDEGVFE